MPERSFDSLTIGEACELAGFAPSALRYYESLDLIEPDEVSASGYRYFAPRKLLFLNFLRSMKDTGLGLTALKHLVPVPNSTVLRQSLGERAVAIERQIRNLRRQAAWLEEARARLSLLDEPLPPRTMKSFPREWRLNGPNLPYDFRGYAVARRHLVERTLRHNLSWSDTMVVRFTANIAGELDFGRCAYSVPIAGSGTQAPGATLREPADMVVDLVRGPIERVLSATKALRLWAEKQGHAVDREVEWHHVVSTAHTANEDDFLTEVRIPLIVH